LPGDIGRSAVTILGVHEIEDGLADHVLGVPAQEALGARINRENGSGSIADQHQFLRDPPQPVMVFLAFLGIENGGMNVGGGA
jgi:hypothetical protein